MINVNGSNVRCNLVPRFESTPPRNHRVTNTANEIRVVDVFQKPIILIGCHRKRTESDWC